MIGQLSADGRPGLVIARRGRHCGNETDGRKIEERPLYRRRVTLIPYFLDHKQSFLSRLIIRKPVTSGSESPLIGHRVCLCPSSLHGCSCYTHKFYWTTLFLVAKEKVCITSRRQKNTPGKRRDRLFFIGFQNLFRWHYCLKFRNERSQTKVGREARLARGEHSC